MTSVASLTMPLIQWSNSNNIMTDEQQSKPFTPEEKPFAQVAKKKARNNAKTERKIDEFRTNHEKDDQPLVSPRVAKPDKSIAIISFDGGSRGNPGTAAGGAVIDMPDGQSITVSRFLSRATNNEAEYTGAIVGLEKALEIGCDRVILQGDSKLVINHLKGVWEVKAGNLKSYYADAKQLLRRFKSVQLQWIPRHKNSRADATANECMDDATGVKAERKKLVGLPKVEPAEKLAGQIQRLIEMGEKAGFKNYMKLKSGNDAFSRVRLPKLAEQVPDAVKEAITTVWSDIEEDNLAKVYRWYLRGLPAQMAVHKVRTDLEISENIKGKSSRSS